MMAEYEGALVAMDAERTLGFLMPGVDRLTIRDTVITRMPFDSVVRRLRNRHIVYDSLPGGHDAIEISLAGENAAIAAIKWWERSYFRDGRQGGGTGATLYFLVRTPAGWKIANSQQNFVRLPADSSRNIPRPADPPSRKSANSEVVTYQSGDETVSAMLYTPGGRGPFPAVMVIHASTGLTDQIKEWAHRLSGEGYAVLAIDLYRGKTVESHEDGAVLAGTVPAGRRERDIDAAMRFLRSRSDVRADRIGALGWCAGGGSVFRLVMRDTALKAAAIHYGRVSSDTTLLRKVRTPVLGIFGGKDPTIPTDTVSAFQRQMERLGKSVEITIYPEAGHAFEFPHITHGPASNGYHPVEAADAWRRTVEFFALQLKR